MRNLLTAVKAVGVSAMLAVGLLVSGVGSSMAAVGGGGEATGKTVVDGIKVDIKSTGTADPGTSNVLRWIGTEKKPDRLQVNVPVKITTRGTPKIGEKLVAKLHISTPAGLATPKKELSVSRAVSHTFVREYPASLFDDGEIAFHVSACIERKNGQNKSCEESPFSYTLTFETENAKVPEDDAPEDEMYIPIQVAKATGVEHGGDDKSEDVKVGGVGGELPTLSVHRAIIATEQGGTPRLNLTITLSNAPAKKNPRVKISGDGVVGGDLSLAMSESGIGGKYQVSITRQMSTFTDHLFDISVTGVEGVAPIKYSKHGNEDEWRAAWKSWVASDTTISDLSAYKYRACPKIGDSYCHSWNIHYALNWDTRLANLSGEFRYRCSGGGTIGAMKSLEASEEGVAKERYRESCLTTDPDATSFTLEAWVEGRMSETLTEIPLIISNWKVADDTTISGLSASGYEECQKNGGLYCHSWRIKYALNWDTSLANLSDALLYRCSGGAFGGDVIKSLEASEKGGAKSRFFAYCRTTDPDATSFTLEAWVEGRKSETLTTIPLVASTAPASPSPTPVASNPRTEGIDGPSGSGGAGGGGLSTPSTTIACAAIDGSPASIRRGTTESITIKCTAKFDGEQNVKGVMKRGAQQSTVSIVVSSRPNGVSISEGSLEFVDSPDEGRVIEATRSFVVKGSDEAALGDAELKFRANAKRPWNVSPEKTASITIDDAVHGEIEYVPQQIDLEDGSKGRLIVSLNPAVASGEVVVDVDAGGIPISLTTTTLTFTPSDTLRVVEFTPTGTAYGELGNITLSIADGSKLRYAADDEEVPVSRKRPFCLPSASGECLYSDTTAVSVKESTGGASGSPVDTYRVDANIVNAAVGVRGNFKYKTKIVFTCHSDEGCDKTTANGGGYPLLMCSTGGVRKFYEDGIEIDTIDGTFTATLENSAHFETGMCTGWSNQPYTLRAITTRAAK